MIKFIKYRARTGFLPKGRWRTVRIIGARRAHIKGFPQARWVTNRHWRASTFMKDRPVVRFCLTHDPSGFCIGGTALSRQAAICHARNRLLDTGVAVVRAAVETVMAGIPGYKRPKRLTHRSR